MQLEGCLECKMFLDGGRYIPPRNTVKIDDAELIVILDSPSRDDARYGEYLSREAGLFLRNVVDPYVSWDKVFVTSCVRCYIGKNAKTPEAKKCYKQYLEETIANLRYQAGNTKRKILLAGFWPPKLVLGQDLREICGHNVQEKGINFAVTYNPSYFIMKYVKWRKVDGVWTKPDGSLERAEADWNQHAIPVVEKLFSGSKADIILGSRHKFPFKRVDDPEEMAELLAMREGKLVGYDVETRASEAAKARGWSALDWFYGPECCRFTSTAFSFFDSLEEITYRPGKHTLEYDPNKVVVYTKNWTPTISRRLARTKVVAFNGSYDTGVVFSNTEILLPIFADPCDMAYVINQGRKKFSLESLVYEEIPEFATYAEDIKKKKLFDKLPKGQLWNYNAGDIIMTMILFWKYAARMQGRMQFLYWDVMAGAKPYLRDAEALGVCLNEEKRQEVDIRISREFQETRAALDSHPEVVKWQGNTPKTWNPGSSGNVLDILARIHGDGVFKSTGKQVLADFQDNRKRADVPPCEFISTLLKYRKLAKTKQTYVDGLAKKQKDGYLYTSFKLNTTFTGRSSSGGGDVVGLGKTNQINIQNITRDGDLRAMFRARPGKYLAYADYGQIEMRVAGAYAFSEEILGVCLSGRDFHGMTTATAYNLEYDFVMAEDAECKKLGTTSWRTKGKSTSFGVLYGMEPLGLAMQLNLKTADGEWDVEAARKFIADYFNGMPSIKSWIDRMHAFVEKHYYVETAFGRKRYFDSLANKTYRESVNTMVQSAASDIFLMSMITTGEALKRRRLYGKYVNLWAEVHDSVTWEVDDCVPKDEIKGIMEECMLSGVMKRFPLVEEFMWKIPLSVDFTFDTVWH